MPRFRYHAVMDFRRLPLLRLLVYLLILGACGAVAMWELYYALCSSTTTGTVIAVGRTSRSRSAAYWADYEYFDADQARHVGRATVHPTTNPFDLVEVQYLRHAPETSRLPPSAAAGLCYGSVALLAIAVFVGEIVTRRRRKRKRGVESG